MQWLFYIVSEPAAQEPQDAHCYLVLDIGPQQSVLIFIGVISEIFSSLVV